MNLTCAEAAAVLDPPVDAEQLADIIRALRWGPAAYRRTGKRGRPVPAYDAARIMALHAAMLPFLGNYVV